MNNIIIQIIINIITIIIFFLIQYYIAYYIQKGKNLATKEDIATITDKIEDVKVLYKSRYDLSVSEREFYNKMIEQIEEFLSRIKKYELEDIKVDKEYIFENEIMKTEYMNFIDSINIILSKAFVFLDDEKYNNLKAAINIDNAETFAVTRLNLLNAMRRSLYPLTEINSSNDLREYYYK